MKCHRRVPDPCLAQRKLVLNLWNLRAASVQRGSGPCRIRPALSSPALEPAGRVAAAKKSYWEELDGIDDDANHPPVSERSNIPIWPRGSLAVAVLGGGETDAKRLWPLTSYRTLPAIPFGGVHRLIDIVMSNCINSGVNKIHVVTAFNTYSLNRYLTRTYNLNQGVPFGGDGYIEVVANSQSPDSSEWPAGTANCVRQFLQYFDSNPKNGMVEDIMVLPSDHLYRIDYTPMIQYHRDHDADVTIICRPVTGEQAENLGIVKVDRKLRIRVFREKPRGADLSDMSMTRDDLQPFLESASTSRPHPHLIVDVPSRTWPWEAAARSGSPSPSRSPSSRSGSHENGSPQRSGSPSRSGSSAPQSSNGSSSSNGPEGPAEDFGRLLVASMSAEFDDDSDGGLSPGSSSAYIGSTGIYIFKHSVLSDVLKRYASATDFGRQVLPALVAEGFKVMAYRMPGYWEDVGGCIKDFHAANMRLLEDRPPLNLQALNYQPIYKYPLTVPGAQVFNSRLSRSLLSPGAIVKDSRIVHSLLGIRSIVGPHAHVEDTYVMGADYYEHEKPQVRPHGPDFPPMGIGESSIVHNAVLDLNVRIGRQVTLVNKGGVQEAFDVNGMRGVCIRDGIIVLGKEAIVPDGTVI